MEYKIQIIDGGSKVRHTYQEYVETAKLLEVLKIPYIAKIRNEWTGKTLEIAMIPQETPFGA
jgi:hypothetical protein